jgi:hypothetical protein
MKDLEIEIWKDIPEFEGSYQVSNLGRVNSITINQPITCALMKSGFVTSQKRSHLKKIQCYELEFSGLSRAFTKHRHVSGKLIYNNWEAEN